MAFTFIRIYMDPKSRIYIYSVYTQDTASQRKCTYTQTLSRRTWTILGFLFQCRYYIPGAVVPVSHVDG